MDGLLMGFAARELNLLLTAGRVDRISQPEDDLVILTIRNGGENRRLLLCATPGTARLHLTEKKYENPAEALLFCMLLRKRLLSGRFLGAEQLFGDRLLTLRFSALDEMGDAEELRLYFEAMGKHSNLTLVLNGRILDAMRHVTLEMSRVRQMLPGLPFVMPPRQDKLAPEEADREAVMARLRGAGGTLDRFLSENIAGLGAMSAAELAMRLCGESGAALSGLDREAVGRDLSALLKALPLMAEPTLLRDLEGVPRALLPFRFISQPDDRQERVPSFSQGMEALYYERELRQRLDQRAAGLRKAVRNARERTERKLALLQEDVLTEEDAEKVRVMGELLTANLHSIPRGAEEVTLPDYYTGGELTIPIDKALTPAANAQRYFKRYRKAHTARKLAAEQKEKALSDLRQLEEALFFLDDADAADDLAAIRGALAESGLLRREGAERGKKRELPARPRTYRSPEGFTILVGRHSIGNERLLRDAAPDDVWLHAKDVPGSHVLIRAEGKPVPEGTLLLAAKLAAWFSQARGQRTRVDYTRRKLVKKVPGGAPGMVHYTGEKGLFVSAAEEDFRAAEREG